MGEEDIERLMEALRQLAESLDPETLRKLLENLLKGRPLSGEELEDEAEEHVVRVAVVVPLPRPAEGLVDPLVGQRDERARRPSELARRFGAG